MDQSSKLFQPFFHFPHQLHNLRKSLTHFLFCLPTTFFAFLLLLLLAYNSFSLFGIHLPSPSETMREPAKFSPETTNGDPVRKLYTSSKLTSSVMYAIKEEKKPQNLNTDLAPLHKFHSPIRPIITFETKKPRSLKRHKRRLRSLSSLAKKNKFSGRIREFFTMNSSSYSCKVRFFMTWISSSELFSDREMLSVESLFKSHPDACLVIISNSMDSEEGTQILKPFSEKGFRVIAIFPHFDFLFKNTYAETWFNQLRKGKVNPGSVSLSQNLSNLLRLTLLYKYGGIYIDTDVIVLKRLSNLRNVIGAQTIDQTGNWSRLNSAVLIFDKNHPLLFKFIEEFALTFDGNRWGHNGPYLVSRVVSRLDERPGFDLKVLPPSSFYPVNWSKIKSLFEGPKDVVHSKWMVAKMRQIYSDSFAVHLWNRQSRKLVVEKGSIVDLISWSCCIVCERLGRNLVGDDT